MSWSDGVIAVELPSQSHSSPSGQLVFFCKFLPRLVEREQSPSIISKLQAKYPKGQLQSSIWSLCTEDWSSLYARLQINIFSSKSNTESNYKPKTTKRVQAAGRRARKEGNDLSLWSQKTRGFCSRRQMVVSIF